MGLRLSRNVSAHTPATLLYEKQLHEFETAIVALEERLVFLNLRKPATLRSVSLVTYFLGFLAAGLVYFSFEWGIGFLFVSQGILGYHRTYDKTSSDSKVNCVALPFVTESVKTTLSHTPSDTCSISAQLKKHSPNHHPQAGAFNRLLSALMQSDLFNITLHLIAVLIPIIIAHIINLGLRAAIRRHFQNLLRKTERKIDEIRVEARLKADELRRITEFERARDVLTRLENVSIPGYSKKMYDMARKSSESVASTIKVENPEIWGIGKIKVFCSACSASLGGLIGSILDRIVFPESFNRLDAEQSRKYALVCHSCHRHNGLALPSEIENLIFVCRFCETLNNPAPKVNLTESDIQDKPTKNFKNLRNNSISRDKSPLKSKPMKPLILKTLSPKSKPEPYQQESLSAKCSPKSIFTSTEMHDSLVIAQGLNENSKITKNNTQTGIGLSNLSFSRSCSPSSESSRAFTLSGNSENEPFMDSCSEKSNSGEILPENRMIYSSLE